MRFTLLGNVYDDGGNERVKTFFQKATRWIQESSEESKGNWKKILANRYSQYLVESANGNTDLLESFCQGCDSPKGCGTCCWNGKKDKGEKNMNTLDRQVDEAFNQPYQKPTSQEVPSYDCIYRITKTGIELTKHAKLDEKAYLEDVRNQENETIEESGSLGTDEKFKVAFN